MSDTGRISVSRDALRAELATMELRLVDKLATKSEVEHLATGLGALGSRVSTLERLAQEADAVRKDNDFSLTKREKWVGMVLGILALALQFAVVMGVFK